MRKEQHQWLLWAYILDFNYLWQGTLLIAHAWFLYGFWLLTYFRHMYLEMSAFLPIWIRCVWCELLFTVLLRKQATKHWDMAPLDVYRARRTAQLSSNARKACNRRHATSMSIQGFIHTNIYIKLRCLCMHVGLCVTIHSIYTCMCVHVLCVCVFYYCLEPR